MRRGKLEAMHAWMGGCSSSVVKSKSHDFDTVTPLHPQVISGHLAICCYDRGQSDNHTLAPTQNAGMNEKF
jgi:hypothetical protein